MHQNFGLRGELEAVLRKTDVKAFSKKHGLSYWTVLKFIRGGRPNPATISSIMAAVGKELGREPSKTLGRPFRLNRGWVRGRPRKHPIADTATLAVAAAQAIGKGHVKCVVESPGVKISGGLLCMIYKDNELHITVGGL